MPEAVRLAFQTPYEATHAPPVVGGGGEDFLLVAPRDAGHPAADADGPFEAASTGDPQTTRLPEALAKRCYLDATVRMLLSTGGVDPRSFALAAAEQLIATGGGAVPVAVIGGRRITHRLEELMVAGVSFANLQTGEQLTELKHPIIEATAVDAPAPLAEALRQGARLIVDRGASLRAMVAACLTPAGRSRGSAEIDQLAGRYADELAFGAGVVEAEKPAVPASPAASQTAADQTRVSIVYRTGYEAQLRFPLGDNANPEDATQTAEAILAAARVPHATAAFRLYRSLAASRPSAGNAVPQLLTVRVEADSFETAQHAAYAATNAAGRRRLFAAERRPAIHPRHEVWPTAVPADVLDWAIDTREAADWVA
ncbi:MAG: acyclic terpene utilization AtuA family protein [Planctomycetota bacterium]